MYHMMILFTIFLVVSIEIGIQRIIFRELPINEYLLIVEFR